MLRDFYAAHHNDPDLWSEPLPPEDGGEQARGVGSSITVRFPADEAARIREFAKRSGQSYSAIIRAAVDRYTQPAFQVATDPYNIPFRLPVADTCAPAAHIELEQPPVSRTGHW